MPKGVTRLEDLEKRHSGNDGTGQPNSSSSAYAAPQVENPAAAADADTDAAAQTSTTGPAQSLTAGPTEPVPSPFAMAADPASQQPSETGKTLLNMLSNAPSMTSARSAAVSPPPGFLANKTPPAISWGSSGQLQGIWGAPTATPGAAPQAVWGPPASSSTSSLPTSAQQALHQSASQQQLWPQHLQQQQSQQQQAQQQQPQLHEVSVQHLEQRLQQPPQSPAVPFGHSPSTPFSNQHDQLARAEQARRALAALGSSGHAASNLLQPDSKGSTNVNAAQNPLLALLGRHNAAAAPGTF